MAEAATAGEPEAAASWSRVAAHLRSAIAAIPTPNMEVVTNPKEMARRLRELCKSLKRKLKEALQYARDMPAHLLSLLKDLASKIKRLILQFYDYICDKVKKFFSWIKGLIAQLKAKFSSSSSSAKEE